jgi:ribosomal protein S18 acetylase RimI-like enzyme
MTMEPPAAAASPVTLSFRVASPDDVDRVVALVESAYRGDASRAGWTTEADLLGGQRTDAAAIEAVVRSPNSRILLASLSTAPDVDVLACCQLDLKPGGLAYFGTFAVQPGTQGGGVGTLLLAEAERVARDELGARTMEMTVIVQRTELLAWYERRGYVRTGERRPFPYGDERFGLPRRDDLEFVVLAKPLTTR